MPLNIGEPDVAATNVSSPEEIAVAIALRRSASDMRKSAERTS
jgi:hypothetical protein